MTVVAWTCEALRSRTRHRARMRMSTAMVLALASCDRVAGIPDLAPDAAPDAPPAETRCDYRDDDGNGLADEGFTYAEHSAARTLLDTGDYPGVFWGARSADRIAMSWITGYGDATGGDVVSLQVFTLDGAPVGNRVTTSFEQPWTINRGFWSDSRFVISATQRSYACGGPNSTTCMSYLWVIDRDGVQVLPPTPIATSNFEVAAAFAEGDRYVMAFLPPSGVGSVRMQSFDIADGTPGEIDRELFATSAGESISMLRPVRDGDTVYWTYNSTTTGFTLRVTDLAGDTLLGPVSLDAGTLGVASRSEHAVVVGETLAVPYVRDGTVSLGRWSLQGGALGTAELPDATIYYAVSGDFDQLYVVTGTRENDSAPPRASIWRFAPDGRVLQAGAPLEIPDGHQYVAPIATPDGVVVAANAYYAGSAPVTLTHIGCP